MRAGDRGLLVVTGQDVLVDRHGDGGAGMADSLAHRLHRHTGTDQRRQVRMSDVMQPDWREPSFTSLLGEPLREPLRMDRAAVLSDEHQATVLPPGAPRHPLFQLPPMVASQHARRFGIDGDGACSPLRLRCVGMNGVVD